VSEIKHKGLVVPWVAIWSSEIPDPSDHPLALDHKTNTLRYLDERPLDRDNMGTLWNRAGLARGVGEPVFGEVHSYRQRACMTVPRCQVCGHRMERITFLLTHSKEHVESNVFTTGTPPTCESCKDVAIKQCPHLRNNTDRLYWVVPTDVRIWGYWGDVALGDSQWNRHQLVSVVDPRRHQLLAKQLVVGIQEYVETPVG